MTEPAYIDIQFKGKGFVPSAFSQGINLPIETLVSSGELGKVGRYKGKPVPYGIGLLKIDPVAESINEYSDVLLKNKAKLKKYNVEEIIFDVDANSSGLEKISISGNLLKKLSSLNARIQFHNHQMRQSDSPLSSHKAATLNANKEKIENFISKASKSEIRNLIFSLLKNPQKNKTIFKKNFKKIVE